jgi:hypothetical protein
MRLPRRDDAEKTRGEAVSRGVIVDGLVLFELPL